MWRLAFCKKVDAAYRWITLWGRHYSNTLLEWWAYFSLPLLTYRKCQSKIAKGTLTHFLPLLVCISFFSLKDYGESHYIGPIKGAQPNSEDWVNGFSHLPWLDLCSHFTKLFKSKFRAGPEFGSGSHLLLREWARHGYQSKHQQQEQQQQQNRTHHHHYHHHSHHREQGQGITYEMDVDEDQIYAWGRPHPRDAVARSDLVGKPKGWQLVSIYSPIYLLTHLPIYLIDCLFIKRHTYILVYMVDWSRLPTQLSLLYLDFVYWEKY